MKKNVLVTALLLLAGNAFVSAQAQAQAQAQSPEPVAGKDYIEIRNGRPLEPADGMVVVEEFFNYICPACNNFEPVFVAWAKQQPSYVKVDHIPAAFRPDFAQYAHAYYAAQIFDIVDETHQAVYDAVHRTHDLPAEGDKPDEARIAKFYSKYGVDADEFLAAMQSFAVETKIRRATQYMQHSKVSSTPSILVNGRYLVQGGSLGGMLRITTYLIEREHSQ